MEQSANVKELVRGWLHAASPDAGRCNLTPPSLVPTFSPRPERLGLGAVPTRDPEEHAYDCRLERRIGRKLAGRGRKDFGDSEELSVKVVPVDSSDDECSRSASICSKITTAKPTKETKHKRKRKKRNRGSRDSSSQPEISLEDTTLELSKEDPVPPKRRGVLRGGAQQITDKVPPLCMTQNFSSPEHQKSHPSDKIIVTSDKTVMTSTECYNNIEHRSQRTKTVTSLNRDTTGNKVRSKRRRNCRFRVSTFPWRVLSSSLSRMRRHRQRREVSWVRV